MLNTCTVVSTFVFPCGYNFCICHWKWWSRNFTFRVLSLIWGAPDGDDDDDANNDKEEMWSSKPRVTNRGKRTGI